MTKPIELPGKPTGQGTAAAAPPTQYEPKGQREHVPAVPLQDDDASEKYPGLQVQEVITEPTVGLEDDVAAGVELTLPIGCALPPAHEPGGEQGAHVPVVPAQRILPTVVDA